MINVLRMGFTKDHFLLLTREERALFLLLGYSSNQVNVLWKLVIAATNRNPENPVDSHVSAAQTHILVRLTIGALWESWRLVEKHMLSVKLGKEIVPALDSAAGQALERLKKRFGSSGMIASVRNSYAFHHPTPEEIELAFQAAVQVPNEDDSWSIYFSKTLLNCFFFASDFVIAHGIMQAVGGLDINKAHQDLLGELAPISNELSELTFGYAAVMLRKYVGTEISAVIAAKLNDAPNLDDVLIPFFVETEN